MLSKLKARFPGYVYPVSTAPPRMRRTGSGPRIYAYDDNGKTPPNGTDLHLGWREPLFSATTAGVTSSFTYAPDGSRFEEVFALRRHPSISGRVVRLAAVEQRLWSLGHRWPSADIPSVTRAEPARPCLRSSLRLGRLGHRLSTALRRFGGSERHREAAAV